MLLEGSIAPGGICAEVLAKQLAKTWPVCLLVRTVSLILHVIASAAHGVKTDFLNRYFLRRLFRHTTGLRKTVINVFSISDCERDDETSPKQRYCPSCQDV